ncbi:hypothetical protein SAMN05421810_10610 [Amycolatopsis arida]|uniref:Uncharacterized protein n=1 Tax=Amycolatopsis arida TaxID=587909 RepID=A0A1I5XE09_9PSEU|nr:hypothetical protein [Amycolatopsis arida]TDX97507.1 hypothetical protein CLV69_102611 [Amycolatopsis arida]SFQ30198.1 hypothetical protein SAMN05421810_10610 [Amycolatopsis arida]
MECPRCTGGIDHCHGTLVLHADGFVECTDPACPDADEPRHFLTIDCAEIDGGCACVALPERELLRAS